MTQMKRLLFCLLLLTGLAASGQVYNNEWIDHAKTYYKFKVGKNGLFRIPQSTLANAGLGGIPAEQFQLWRNGVQVPIYTSVASGTLSGSDYIEFWGEMNDGKADKAVYRRPEYQLNDKWSLLSDSATYFLTVNPAGSNRRLVTTTNNVSGNTLPAEPYFMYKAGNYYRERIHNGFAVNVGDYMYSSSYDKGEGWASGDIGVNETKSFTFSDLYIYSGGPAARFTIAVSGNAINQRRYIAKINNDSITGNVVDFFNYTRDTAVFASSLLALNSATVGVTNITSAGSDRMVVHQYELTYPRQFNFGGAANFEFTLPASAAGNYLEIAGFAFGSAAPVLYDLTNGQRYVGEVAGSLVKVALAPSATERKLVLVSEEAANVSSIAGLQSRTFVDYRQQQNQGDYLIISNPILFNANGTDPVEAYRLYRSSNEGGAYNARTYLADDLIDQFAFGIKKHPMGIRNFIQFARNTFTVTPKHVFIIGKGVDYVGQRYNEGHADIHRLNLIPTFGWPASDILLAADPGDSYPKTSIGRLSVINGQEVATYLKKVKDHEANQRTPSPYIKDKAWMKNIVHAVGSSEPGLQLLLDNYMRKYKAIASDTLFGANVHTFTKSSPDVIEQINSNSLNKLFEDGISLITYFGHSSTTALDFNLNNPEQYNNPGKYPMFIALGCNVGNFYNFNTLRFLSKETLSEKFVLAQDRGTIGFIASSHFGIVHYLDIYNERTYKAMAYKNYGQPIGNLIQSSIAQTFAYTTQEDFYARATCEETILNGDPAVTLNPHPKADYVVEDNMVSMTPAFVSVADESFKLRAKFLNIGKAVSQNIVVQVKRVFPNQTSQIVYTDTIPGIRFSDSISVDIPIDPLTDKGLNKLTVTIDVDNEVEELFETNNSITKEIMIYEDEARPIYPYNFSIVNKQGIKLVASTANPFATSKTYRVEVDTSALFATPLASGTRVSVGGVIEFDPGVTFQDNTVYYWRVAQVPDSGSINWNTFSFIYMANQELGFNQSHLYQHFHSQTEKINYDSTSTWRYGSVLNTISIRNAMIGPASWQEGDVSMAVNGDFYMRNDCGHASIVFNVFDPNSGKPWTNPNGRYGSASMCSPTRLWNFEYSLRTQEGRKRAMDFMDSIPDGAYVVARSMLWFYPQGVYVDDWLKDEAINGAGKTLYHKMKAAGFATIDSFNRPRVFAFVYQKGNSGFAPVYDMSPTEYEILTLSVDFYSKDSIGHITSPDFGPAKTWKQLQWGGSSVETDPTDYPTIDIIGIKPDGSKATLLTGINKTQQTFDISSIDAKTYPYLRLQMRNADSIHFTPYQLKYWRLTYEPKPEGALAPNILFTMKDTLEVGEPITFKMAFKNVSDVAFDSVKVKVLVTDRNNNVHQFVDRLRPINPSPDTLQVRLPASTAKLVGDNLLFVDVNPDNDQPEQHHFNNLFYRTFYVRGDSLNPVMDVTFDNTHILSGDIVAAKPDIMIKLKDEAKWMLLDDTSLVNIQVIDPDGIARAYHFNSDTLRFIPAQQTPNAENTATINFKPHFLKDGTYKMMVTGKDRSENRAGNIQYSVDFQVINKPMISNMLNYPNPFTTSTAFVFTITGVEVPQNLKIQILTVTGKIVREITKEELGPLRVGRNITEFKWDGTDQYGQKLANGVYLYRVVTNLNGKSLDKYTSESDNTDKYFNKGYGKMYLMR